MEHIGAEVHLVEPEQRPEVGVYANLAEELDVLQLLEDTTAAKDSVSEVQLGAQAVGEGHLNT